MINNIKTVANILKDISESLTFLKKRLSIRELNEILTSIEIEISEFEETQETDEKDISYLTLDLDLEYQYLDMGA